MDLSLLKFIFSKEKWLWKRKRLCKFAYGFAIQKRFNIIFQKWCRQNKKSIHQSCATTAFFLNKLNPCWDTISFVSITHYHPFRLFSPHLHLLRFYWYITFFTIFCSTLEKAHNNQYRLDIGMAADGSPNKLLNASCRCLWEACLKMLIYVQNMAQIILVTLAIIFNLSHFFMPKCTLCQFSIFGSSEQFKFYTVFKIGRCKFRFKLNQNLINLFIQLLFKLYLNERHSLPKKDEKS